MRKKRITFSSSGCTAVSNRVKERHVEWDGSKNLDNYIEAGYYTINGYRGSLGDNMPIGNFESNDAVSAVLFVTDSGYADTVQRNRIVGQTLILSDRVGGDTKIFTRSCNIVQEVSGWTSWNVLQGVGEKGSVPPARINEITDNGMFTGVIANTNSTAQPLAVGNQFLMVVINNRQTVLSLGSNVPVSVTQLFYVLPYSATASPSMMRSAALYFRTGIVSEGACNWGAWKKVADDDIHKDIEAIDKKIVAESERAITAEASLAKHISVDVQWNYESHINTYVAQGIYTIKGERTNLDDGLPIDNVSPGHTISARLTVLDSSINESEVCITQVLMLSNRMGGDGNIYIRTGNSSSHSELQNMLSSKWSRWQKLQGVHEVGIVRTYDAFIDNGIYTGIYTDGSSLFDTFLIITLNNYVAASVVSAQRRICQLKYSLSVGGSVNIKKRLGEGGSNITWGSWGD